TADMREDISEFAEEAKETLAEWKEKAAEKTADMREDIEEFATEAKEKIETTSKSFFSKIKSFFGK
ncbi:MAG TPA: hypothetical protein PLG24_11020, partial [Saprospiraceae bacterium]|nr:hypothetical protein [Saprospiraceae bacterium]